MVPGLLVVGKGARAARFGSRANGGNPIFRAVKTLKKAKILCVAILGLIACFVILGVVWRKAASVPIQSERRIVPSRSTASKAEAVFPINREPKNYDIIVENNLFRPLGWKRDIGPPVQQNPTPISELVDDALSPLPTYGLALTGIVKKGPYFFAVVEDQNIRTGMFLRRGEALKDTTVQEIYPNHITLARGEMAVQLALGERIEYGTDGRVIFGTVTRQQKKLEEPSESNNTAQDLIERMREKRRNELNQ